MLSQVVGVLSKPVSVSKRIMFEMLCAVDVFIFMQFSLLESHTCFFPRCVFLVWMCHGHCASEEVGGQFSFFLVWFADCTFLNTFCADQCALVSPASRCFCLTMADSPKLAVLRDFEHLMQSVRLMHSMTTR